MKTARQILLERHASAQSDLDALRCEFIGTLQQGRRPWWQTAWREVFLAARPAWTALGALAFVALGLQVGSMDTRPAVSASRPLSGADLTTVREQRHRLWAELLEPAGETSPPPPANRYSQPPPHRSEAPVNLWHV